MRWRKARSSRCADGTNGTSRCIGLIGRRWPEDPMDQLGRRGARFQLRDWLSSASLGVLLVLGSSASAFAAAAVSCPSSGLDLSDGQSLTVAGDCTVAGDLTLHGTSFLVVTESRFVLRGNLTARDGAILYVQ